jgi:hypothetical protein
VSTSEIEENPARSEKNTVTLRIAAERRRLVGGDHFLDHARREIEPEGLVQKSPVLVGDQKPEAGRRAKTDDAREQRLDQRQRQRRICESEHGAEGPQKGRGQISRHCGEQRQRQCCHRDYRGECKSNRAAADYAKLNQRIAAYEVVDRGGVRIDAGRRVAGKSRARRRLRQHATRSDGVFRGSGEAFRRHLPIFNVEHGRDEHDLAGKVGVEKFVVAFFDAGAQIGQKKSGSDRRRRRS